MSMMAAIRDLVWRVDRARQVLVASLALAVVFAIGFSLWSLGLIPGFGWGHADVHTGTLVVTTKDDAVCKQMKFDNESFRISAIKMVPCDMATAADGAPQQPKASNGSHLDAIREGFRAR
jgi:hypothetical protein